MIFHVDLDAFFASVEQRDNPNLRGKPILVGNTDPHGKTCHRGVVATCSYEARAFGVKSGMPIFEALKLCPYAIIVGGRFEKYEEASSIMYKIFANYTDQIEPIGLDEAFLSFYGFEKFYNYDLLKVARNIKNDIVSQIGITASCGIAQNKVVAKISSGYQKPDGLTFIPNGKEKEFLSKMPIGKLYGIGYSIEAKLTKMGIDTIGQFANLSQNTVKSIFGKYGQTIWLWSNGKDSQELSPPPPIKSVGRSQTFPFNTNDANFIKATLFFLCQKIASELRQENLKGKCITTSIRYADLTFCSHQRKLCSPIFLAKEIYQISSYLLDEFWDSRPLRLVGARVSHFGLENQLEFETAKKEKQEKLEEAVDQIRGKHGFWIIYPTSLTTILPFEEKREFAVPKITKILWLNEERDKENQSEQDWTQDFANFW